MFSITAIIFSIIAKKSSKRGRFDDAKEYSKCAKIFNIIGIIVGILGIIATAIALGVIYGTASKQEEQILHSQPNFPSYIPQNF